MWINISSYSIQQHQTNTPYIPGKTKFICSGKECQTKDQRAFRFKGIYCYMEIQLAPSARPLKVHSTKDLPSLPSVATLSTPIQAQQTPELFIITCGPSGVSPTDTSSICSPLYQKCHFWPSLELSEGFHFAPTVCELLFLSLLSTCCCPSVCLPSHAYSQDRPCKNSGFSSPGKCSTTVLYMKLRTRH